MCSTRDGQVKYPSMSPPDLSRCEQTNYPSWPELIREYFTGQHFQFSQYHRPVWENRVAPKHVPAIIQVCTDLLCLNSSLENVSLQTWVFAL